MEKFFLVTLDDQVKAVFKKLDLPILRKIFTAAKGSDFLNNSYLNAILERRDQVLRHCLKINRKFDVTYLKY
ncbi:hypothetical protein [Candidatus Tisiphia endosymbiont of Ditula angustiorana]|uniref:hypothetical protein n=1 Tax=Candidatus Tisiphia endosymbiont of Ditula angustiorana TaxID=3066272 RepID=UPI00312CA37A